MCGGNNKWSTGEEDGGKTDWVVISDISGTKVDNQHFKSKSYVYIKIVSMSPGQEVERCIIILEHALSVPPADCTQESG